MRFDRDLIALVEADKPRKSANLRAFDNMVRFDKAALFLSLGVVKCRPSK
jgi:hypothetical protein